MVRSGATSPVPVPQPEAAPLIEVNDFVFVRPLPPATEVRRGICRFAGKSDFADGFWIGVELVGSIGRNSGAVGERLYFTCLPGQGVFVRPELVDRIRVQSLADLVPSQPLPPGFDLQIRADLEVANETIALREAQLKDAEDAKQTAEFELDQCQEELLSALEENKALQTAVDVSAGSGGGAGGSGSGASTGGGASVELAKQLHDAQGQLATERKQRQAVQEKLHNAMAQLESLASASALVDDLTDQNLAFEDQIKRLQAAAAATASEKEETQQMLIAQDEELLQQAAEADRLGEELSALKQRHGEDVAHRDATIGKMRALLSNAESKLSDEKSARTAVHSELSSVRSAERASAMEARVSSLRLAMLVPIFQSNKGAALQFVEDTHRAATSYAQKTLTMFVVASAPSSGQLVLTKPSSQVLLRVGDAVTAVSCVCAQLASAVAMLATVQDTMAASLLTQSAAFDVSDRLFAAEFLLTMYHLQSQADCVLAFVAQESTLQALALALTASLAAPGESPAMGSAFDYELCRSASLFARSVEDILLAHAESGAAALPRIGKLLPVLLRSLREIVHVVERECKSMPPFIPLRAVASLLPASSGFMSETKEAAAAAAAASSPADAVAAFSSGNYLPQGRTVHSAALSVLRTELSKLMAFFSPPDPQANSLTSSFSSLRKSFAEEDTESEASLLENDTTGAEALKSRLATLDTFLGQAFALLSLPGGTSGGSGIAKDANLDSGLMHLSVCCCLVSRAVELIAAAVHEADDDVRRGLVATRVTPDLVQHIDQLLSKPVQLVNGAVRLRNTAAIRQFYQGGSPGDHTAGAATAAVEDELLCVSPLVSMVFAVDVGVDLSTAGFHGNSLLTLIGNIAAVPLLLSGKQRQPVGGEGDTIATPSFVDVALNLDISLVEIARGSVQALHRSWGRNLLLVTTPAAPAAASSRTQSPATSPSSRGVISFASVLAAPASSSISSGSLAGGAAVCLQFATAAHRADAWSCMKQRLAAVMAARLQQVLAADRTPLAVAAASTAVSSVGEDTSPERAAQDETHSAAAAAAAASDKKHVQDLEGQLWELRAKLEAYGGLKHQLLGAKHAMEAQERQHVEHLHTVERDYESALAQRKAEVDRGKHELRLLKQRELQTQLAPVSQRERMELVGTVDMLRWQLWSQQANTAITSLAAATPSPGQMLLQLATSTPRAQRFEPRSRCLRTAKAVEGDGQQEGSNDAGAQEYGEDTQEVLQVLRFTSKKECQRSRSSTFQAASREILA